MGTRKPKQTEPEQPLDEQQPEGEPVADALEGEPQSEPEGQPEPAPGVVAQRKVLREQGYKRCPTHERYLNRLPEAVREPVPGFADPAIRPLSEFNRHIAACRACISIRSKDHRIAKQQAAKQESTDAKQE